ncbi:MAG TPA: hypothetical protein DEB39_03720 [Planctomycetaceae bacterium]|nr:hypothetical protein [Planctomycetaceae bacterium]
MTAFIEKTIKYLVKTDDPAAIALLRPLLDDADVTLRGLAFEAFYLKKNPDLFLELFDRYAADPEAWKPCPQITHDRLGKVVLAAIRSEDKGRMALAKQMVSEHKIYEAMSAFVPLIESADAETARYGAEGVQMLGEMFYKDLSDAPSAVARANLDRQRLWLATELDGVVKRYGMHGMLEPLRAMLMVAKKDYETFQTVTKDIHSAASKKVMEILTEEDHPGFYRLLLSFVDDSDSPPTVDVILAAKTEPLFVRYMLKVIGDSPSDNAKKALKRFTSFAWLTPRNPDLTELIAEQEVPFVRLITNMSLPREQLLATFRRVMKDGNETVRRAVAEALRQYPGDDFNALVMEVLDDPDATVCSHLLRIVKSRNFKGADDIITRFVARQNPEINKTIFDLMPDFRIDSFLSRMGQYAEHKAYTLGNVVRNVDPSTAKVLENEVSSFVALRRQIACDAIRYTGMGGNFLAQLCRIAEADDEANTRIAALHSLADILVKEAIVALQDAMQDKSFVIREAATASAQKWMKKYQEATAKK